MRQTLSITLVLALTAAACGVGSEAELRASIQEATRASIDDVSTTESACVADALISGVGFDGLEAAGLTRDALAADPGALRTNALAEDVNHALISCIDLSSRLGRQSRSAGLASLDLDCVVPEALTADGLGVALVDGQSLLGPETPTLVTEGLTDALRGCVDDTDFARVAGLDSPAELAAVLVADPFSPEDSQDPCVIDAVISTVGIERLAELEISVGSPDFIAVTRDLDDALRDEIVVAVTACDLEQLLTTHLSMVEAQMADCTVDGISPDDRAELTALRFDDRNITMRAAVRAPFDDCVEDRLDELFPPESDEINMELYRFNLDLISELTGGLDLNDYEEMCVSRGVRTTFDDLDEIDAADAAFVRMAQGTANEEDIELGNRFVLDTMAVLDACADPWKRLGVEMTTNGVREDTVNCIEEEAPDLAAALNEANRESIEGDFDAALEVWDLLDDLEVVLEQCGTAAEVASWRAYLDDSSVAGTPIET